MSRPRSQPVPAETEPAHRAPPLLLTRDPVLREHVLRLAAAAGSAPRPCEEPSVALRAWAGAAVVLVGADAAAEVAALAPARREAVRVLGWGPATDEVYRSALGIGASEVLELPRADATLAELLTDPGEHAAPRGLVIGVVGGCGGAGASTFAAALGQVASQQGRVVVLDADPLGPGLDRLLGLDDRPGVRWEDLGASTGRLGGRALRDAVPRRGRLGVLTWQAGASGPAPAAEPAPAVAREVLHAARRGHDTVVVDLPRTGGAVAADLAARVDHVVLVGRPGLGAAAATVRLCARLEAQLPAGTTPLLLVRGSPLDADRLQRATGLPLLLPMGDQRGLAEAVDLGLGPVARPRGTLGRAARECLGLLAVRGPRPTEPAA